MQKSNESAYFSNLSPEHIQINVNKRFDLEHISRFFGRDQINFEGDSLSFSKNQCTIINFLTLKSSFPEYYNSNYYRILVIFKFISRDTFFDETSLIVDIEQIRQRENVEQFVLLCEESNRLPFKTLSLLKQHGVHVFYLNERILLSKDMIPSFIYDRRLGEEYNLYLNVTCDEIVKRLKKLFHIALSDIAAPVYDKMYGKAKYATERVMKREEELVDSIISERRTRESGDRDDFIAVDVGTGTGRHAFRFRERFSRVHAFDFSKFMIAEATKKKLNFDDRKISFSVADFEYEDIAGESEFSGKVDFICASFGMASFIEDTSRMLRRFHKWLRAGGDLYLSFYNSNTVVETMTPNWRDTSLAAHLDRDRETLQVTLNSDTTFHVFCRAYNDKTGEKIAQLFDVVKIFSYPTLTAMLPNSMFDNSKAKEFFSYIDNSLIDQDQYQYGHYVFVHARKNLLPGAFPRVLSLVHESGVEYNLKEHESIYRAEQLADILNVDKSLVVKTMVLVIGRSATQSRKGSGQIAIVVVLSNKEVDMSIIARELSVREGDVSLATKEIIIQHGFILGSVSPFGFEDAASHHFVTKSLLNIDDEKSIYIGSGNNQRTIEMKVRDAKKLMKNYRIVDF